MDYRLAQGKRALRVRVLYGRPTPPYQNTEKRAEIDSRTRQARGFNFFLRNGPAVPGFEEEAEQALAGGSTAATSRSRNRTARLSSPVFASGWG